MKVDKSQSWNMSIGEFFKEAVERNATSVFIEISGQKVTYQECFDRSLRTASMFKTLGIAKGDRVALFLPNCPEFLYCWFGLSMIGAVSVPINTAYKRDESFYILNMTIKKVTEDLNSMKFNTGLSTLMEFVNYFQNNNISQSL